jgi:hypothetical protein
MLREKSRRLNQPTFAATKSNFKSHSSNHTRRGEEAVGSLERGILYD